MRKTLALFVIALVAVLRATTAFAGPWATQQEISSALQTHGTAVFGDAALRGGKLRVFKTRAPVIWRGGLAVVVQVTDAKGQNWAVRIPISKPPHDRHQAIAKAIHASGLSGGDAGLFPELEHQEQGIQLTVGGKKTWLPVMKMAWVDGKSLDAHVDALIESGDHAALDQLAETWRDVQKRMRAKQMAHGDLSHGNVRVSNQKRFKLIDYDDTFIPHFAGEAGIGNGNPAYNHPERSIDDYHLDVDNFSMLAIYVSLKALAVDPSMWKNSDIHMSDGDGEGDNLIFRQADFANPRETPVWKALAKSPSKQVRELAAKLADHCDGSVREVPHLEAVLGKESFTPTPAPKVSRAPRSTVQRAQEEEDEEAPQTATRPVTHKPSAVEGPPKKPGAGATAGELASYRVAMIKYELALKNKR